MKQVSLDFEIIKMDSRESILKHLEVVGRNCYKSEDKITDESAKEFTEMIMHKTHLPIIEHAWASVRIICNRGVSHEQVRHRLASYAQESTRYCNYSKGKFGGEITVIETPAVIKDEHKELYEYPQRIAEEYYFKLIEAGYTPQIARGVLPINLKTDIIITTNFTEWLHIFKMRCDKTAHPQIREIMVRVENAFKSRLPEVFGESNG